MLAKVISSAVVRLDMVPVTVEACTLRSQSKGRYCLPRPSILHKGRACLPTAIPFEFKVAL